MIAYWISIIVRFCGLYRFIAIGPVAGGVVVVVYTEPEEDAIRIISARPATRREVGMYRKHMDGYR